MSVNVQAAVGGRAELVLHPEELELVGAPRGSSSARAAAGGAAGGREDASGHVERVRVRDEDAHARLARIRSFRDAAPGQSTV